MFKIAEPDKHDKILRNAALLRFVGTAIAVLIFAAGFILLLWVFKHRAR
jgi:hypothetical protein